MRRGLRRRAERCGRGPPRVAPSSGERCEGDEGGGGERGVGSGGGITIGEGKEARGGFQAEETRGEDEEGGGGIDIMIRGEGRRNGKG